MSIYLCRRCGFWSRDREAVLSHLYEAHQGEAPIRITDFVVRDEPGKQPIAYLEVNRSQRRVQTRGGERPYGARTRP